MSQLVLERRRTGWDVVWGVLLVIAGLVVLGDVVLATAVSVLLLTWVVIGAGIVALIAALARIGRGGFWATALAGALLLALGVVMVHNQAATALTLTLLAGALFLASGLTRLVAATHEPAYRLPLVLGGIVSLVLGLVVLFHWVAASFTLLGILLGVQVLVDGISLLLSGRAHVDEVPAERP